MYECMYVCMYVCVDMYVCTSVRMYNTLYILAIIGSVGTLSAVILDTTTPPKIILLYMHVCVYTQMYVTMYACIYCTYAMCMCVYT